LTKSSQNNRFVDCELSS